MVSFDGRSQPWTGIFQVHSQFTDGLLIAGNVSIHLLTGSLPLYYMTTAVIALTNNNTMENETKLDGSEQHTAIFIANLYSAYVNKMAREFCSNDDFLQIEVQIHFKLNVRRTLVA